MTTDKFSYSFSLLSHGRLFFTRRFDTKFRRFATHGLTQKGFESYFPVLAAGTQPSCTLSLWLQALSVIQVVWLGTVFDSTLRVRIKFIENSAIWFFASCPGLSNNWPASTPPAQISQVFSFQKLGRTISLAIGKAINRVNIFTGTPKRRSSILCGAQSTGTQYTHAQTTRSLVFECCLPSPINLLLKTSSNLFWQFSLESRVVILIVCSCMLGKTENRLYWVYRAVFSGRFEERF